MFQLDRWHRVAGLTRGMEGSSRAKKAALFFAAGLNRAEAARIAGYEKGNASMWRDERQERNVEKAQDRMIKFLDARGVGLSDIAQNIAAGIRARRLTRFGDEDDHQAQIKYNDMALKVHGAYAPTKSIQDVRKVSLTGNQIALLRQLKESGELEPRQMTEGSDE